MNSNEKILTDELTTLKDDIIKRHQENGQVVTGQVVNSYSVKASGNEGQLIGFKYARTLQTGRGPAKNTGGGDSNFLDNLRQWITAKGIQFDTTKQADNFARFLKWYINKNGNKLFRSGKQLDIFTTPIADFEKRLAARIGSAYSQDIITELNKLNNEHYNTE